jgi:hypothetical protein
VPTGPAGFRLVCYEGRPEKAAGQYPAAYRAQNLAFENARPPRLCLDLHWRADEANQNCCSLEGTKKLLRSGHGSSRFNFRLRPHLTLGCIRTRRDEDARSAVMFWNRGSRSGLG